MKKIATLIILLCLLYTKTTAQKTDANIVGHVTSENEHIPFASVSIKGTSIGCSADESGHFQLINLKEGIYTIQAQALGYKLKDTTINLQRGKTIEIKFDLNRDALNLNEIVVTGNRIETSRKNATTIVTVISPKLLSSSQSATLAEGLQFSSGLRVENNCQNCGFNQVRMNGMEGPYSQILINSRPIFSSLAGVYGLELIPANIIDKIEVIKGGSAIYGSNAIAGTINVILKDPVRNSYNVSCDGNLIGAKSNYNQGSEYSLNANTSIVSSNTKSGLTLYTSLRKRNHFDANNDSFSELCDIYNTTFGGRMYYRFSNDSKLDIDFLTINEKRRGGNKFNLPEHETDITEGAEHNINNASATYHKFFNKNSKLTIFASAMHINRDSYYGAKQSLSDYGNTNNITYSAGSQLNINFNNSNLVIGLENNGEFMKDKKLGYPLVDDSLFTITHIGNTTIVNQTLNTIGTFSQYEIEIRNLKIAGSIRLDHYKITNKSENTTSAEFVPIPRLTAKYNLIENTQIRATWSQGYRTPQIFDEDLHILTSGSRQIIHENDPNLTKESSNSIMLSVDHNFSIKNSLFSILIEGFYIKLSNPFSNIYGIPDSTGLVVYTRTNAKSGAVVNGVNIETNIIPNRKIDFKLGFTFQNSNYETEQDFDTKKFLRTPNDYGFFNINYNPSKKWTISSSATYTGKMLIPYFGPLASDQEHGELRKSDIFFNLGLRIEHTFSLNSNKFQIYIGLKNIFNSYQSDFDYGIQRDPGYMYGPGLPRTIFAGFKIGNFI